MTIPRPLDTTALARAQDSILSRHNYTRAEAAGLLASISQWDPLLATQPTSNLVIRQKLITLGLLRLTNAPIKGSFASVEDDFNSLRRNDYWLEGPDYCWYTKTAFLWHADVVGGMRPEIQTAFDRMWGNYLRLVAPDGSLAVPEASERRYPVPAREADTEMHEDGSWLCVRWPSGAYLLVGVDGEVEPRGNFHYKQAAGYFALWLPSNHNGTTTFRFLSDDGERSTVEAFGMEPRWAARCKPYEGWNPASVPTDNGLQQLLPPGALLPTWRIRPPRIRVSRLEDGVRIRWSNDKNWFDCVREIRWDAEWVEVQDKYAGIGREKRVWDV